MFSIQVENLVGTIPSEISMFKKKKWEKSILNLPYCNINTFTLWLISTDGEDIRLSFDALLFAIEIIVIRRYHHFTYTTTVVNP